VFNKCLTKAITTDTSDSINGGYKPLPHGYKLLDAVDIGPLVVTFIVAVFGFLFYYFIFLLFSCR
jgi:hypothetical protein